MNALVLALAMVVASEPEAAPTGASEVPVVRPTPAPPAQPAAPLTAAERMRGALGFGFFGTVTSEFVLPGFNPAPVSVPLLGARYWTPLAFGPVKRLGVELAGGVMLTGGESDAPGPSGPNVTKDSTNRALSLHVGVPFVLGGGEHMLVSLAPEFRVTAFDLVPAEPATPPLSTQTRMSGVTTTDLGLRAGAELFFSFIGLPNLSVEASVRLGMRWRDQRLYLNGFLFSDRTFALNTSLVNDPWDLFTGAVSAKYYF